MGTISQIQSLPRYVFCWGICFIFTFNNSTAQISQGGEPLSFQLDVSEEPERMSMPAVDIQALLMEDQLERESATPVPPRFGFAHEVDLDIHRHGTWTELEDGSKLWRLKIHTEGAYSINLIYNEFYLPVGSTFFLYNDDKTDVIGAFTESNNKEYGTFSTTPVAGDITILEYYEPADVRDRVKLRVSHVVHAYRNLFNWELSSSKSLQQSAGYGESLSCNININCSQGNPYQDQKRAVAMILNANGQRICTGSLLNNVRENGIPYFLTADHCLDTGVNNWLFMFNYESPGCSNSNGPTNQTVSGATLRANFADTDFALLQLSSQPHPTYNTYYLGWSAQSTAPQSTTIIHHPRGDIKKISFDFDPATSNTNWINWDDGTFSPPHSHWAVSLTDGTLEPGSSGAPHLNQNKRVVGQVHGGNPVCPNPSVNFFTGRFDVSWTGGGTDATRLRNWLDPDNTNTLVLDGMNAPVAPVINGDWAFFPGATGQWTASAYGGEPPYNFSWHRSYTGSFGPWTHVGTGTTYSQTVNQEMWLGLTVFDSTPSSNVTVQAITLLVCDNPPCLQAGNAHAASMTSATAGEPNEAKGFKLHPNYPNPFNPETTIRFHLPESAHVRLTVYDIMGREIARLADGVMNAGEHQATWDARSKPSGMYIMRLEAGADSQNRTMILLK